MCGAFSFMATYLGHKFVHTLEQYGIDCWNAFPSFDLIILRRKVFGICCLYKFEAITIGFSYLGFRKGIILYSCSCSWNLQIRWKVWILLLATFVCWKSLWQHLQPPFISNPYSWEAELHFQTCTLCFVLICWNLELLFTLVVLECNETDGFKCGQLQRFLSPNDSIRSVEPVGTKYKVFHILKLSNLGLKRHRTQILMTL